MTAFGGRKRAIEAVAATKTSNRLCQIAEAGREAAPAVEGVDLVSGNGILFGTINSVATKDKTVEQWHTEVVEAVEKISAVME